MQIHFHGATRTVTGSLHEIRANSSDGKERTILLDCGLFQGPRDLARKINCCFDFDVKTVDAVILSHGHTDHCGNLPNLVKQGYKGPIWCTPATAAVTELMLLDSAKIQQENADYLNRKPDKSWQGQIEPLYTIEDAQHTIALFKPLPYRQPTQILPGIVAELRDAGHTLGSAAVSLTESSTGKVLVFTGDVGRPHAPLLNDPDPFTHADAVISECTYGGKTHAPIAEIPNILAGIINDTIQRGGVLMIPAFALGRTQAMLEEIHQLRDQKKIPNWLTFYVDSPLGAKLTQLHRQFDSLLDEETRAMLQPFDFPNLTYVATVDQSRALNDRKDPFVVIAGSGMCESGRILHHLKHHIADPRSTVLLPGYQAENTLGRKIQDAGNQHPNQNRDSNPSRHRQGAVDSNQSRDSHGATSPSPNPNPSRDRQGAVPNDPHAGALAWVPILGDRIPLRCHVETLHGLSAHADGAELVAYTQPLRNAGVPARISDPNPACQAATPNSTPNPTRARQEAVTPAIYLVHGELPQAQAHQLALTAAGFPKVTIPTRGDIVNV